LVSTMVVRAKARAYPTGSFSAASEAVPFVQRGF
jgi:hypothetical protein